MRRNHRTGAAAGALCLLTCLAPGCGRKPTRDLCAVSGRITIHGRAATSGTVSYRPVDPRVGHQPTGTVDPQGRYTLYTSSEPGAPAGEYRVLVFVHEQPAADAVQAHPTLPRTLIDPVYQDPQRTPLQVHVTETAAPGTYDLEVRDALPTR
jgi:hypothetical protein